MRILFVATLIVASAAMPLIPSESPAAVWTAAPDFDSAANWTTPDHDDLFGNETTAIADVEQGEAMEPFQLENIFHFFLANIQTLFHTAKEQQVLITYIQVTPALQCGDVRRVLRLYDQRLGETNPHARNIQSKPIQLGGRACNATRCHCDGKRALGAKTLKVETRAVASAKLMPVASFPLATSNPAFY